MASTISGYTYEEMAAESGHGNIETEITAVRIFKIAWTDLKNFLLALVGGWTAINPDTQTFAVGDEHPDWTGVLYCDAAEWEPFGKATGMTAGKSTWEFAKVTATYRRLKVNAFSGSGVEIAQEDIDISLEHERTPGGTYEVTSDSTDVPDDDTKIVPIGKYSLTLLNAANLPGGSTSTIFGMLGKVNNATFKGAVAGTMLYLGAQASRSASVSATSPWKIKHNFLFRPVEWTKIFVSSKGTYVTVRTKVGSVNKYLAGSFASLFPA